MTIVVTRNAPERYRGFLASVMLEIAPGTYVSPYMQAGVRERVWNVCVDWVEVLPVDGSITMIWRDATQPSGLRADIIGAPKAELQEHDGIWLDRHDLTAAEQELLRELLPTA